MRDCLKLIVVILAATSLLATAGCGKSGQEGNTASINGSADPKLPDAPKGPPDDPQHPTVLIETSLGKIACKLDADKAPLTVLNFLSYVSAGHYDQTIFHQALKGYAVLGGTYTPQLVEKKASTPVRNEAHNGLKNRRGTIAMARQAGAIDSATSQFFINLADNPALDFKDRTPEGYGYCVFGEVTDGLDIVEKIGAVAVQDKDSMQRMPVEPVVIQSIRRVR